MNTSSFDYPTYLASREWALKKEKIRERSGGICERCHQAPYQSTHHLTYARIGNELLEDLKALCSACHKFLSGKSDVDPISKPVISDKLYLALINDARDKGFLELFNRSWSIYEYGVIVSIIYDADRDLRIQNALEILDWKLFSNLRAVHETEGNLLLLWKNMIPGAPKSLGTESASRTDGELKASLLAEIKKSKAVLYNLVVAQAQKIEVAGDRVTFTFSAAQRTLSSTLDQHRPWLEGLAQQLAGRKIAIVGVQGEAALACTFIGRKGGQIDVNGDHWQTFYWTEADFFAEEVCGRTQLFCSTNLYDLQLRESVRKRWRNGR